MVIGSLFVRDDVLEKSPIADDLIPHGLSATPAPWTFPTPLRVNRERTPGAALRLRYARASLGMLALFDIAARFNSTVAGQLGVIGFLLVVPGALLLDVYRIRPSESWMRLGYAVATSLVLMMFISLVMSAALPTLGVGRPLDALPMAIAFNAIVLILILAATRRGDPVNRWFDEHQRGLVPAVAALALLPLAAVGGAELLNNGRSSLVAQLAAIATCCVLVATVFVGDRASRWWNPTVLYFAALGALLAFSMRSNHLFGFDIQQEIQAFRSTANAGVWRVPSDGNPYAAMLSITAVPTVLAKLSGMSGVTIFKVVYPAIFALMPVVVFGVAARWASRAAAYIAAGLLIALPQFGAQLAAIARQEMALLIFAVMIGFAFDTTVSVRARKVGVGFAAFGLSAAHYSTAYATVGALLTAHVVYGGFRLWRNAAHAGVFTFKMVLGIAAIVFVWNSVITDSSQNLTFFLRHTAERGADILPNGKDGSVVDRWLSGNTVAPISGKEFTARARGYYGDQLRFLSYYPREVQDAFPVGEGTAPVNPPRVAGVRGGASVLRIGTSQVGLFATAIGVCWLTWKRRRNETAVILEFATLAFAFLCFLMFMRVSGVAAEAYNQDRAQLHAAVLLSVGLATTIGWWLRMHRRLVLGIAAVALCVSYLASSGITSLVGGGDISPTMANRGEAYERFFVTTQESAAAQWLAKQTDRSSIIFADRYGKLRLWGATSIVDVFDTLAPGTIDQRSWVYASRPNVVEGRARGQLNQYSSSYAFPGAFLEANKNIVYANSFARIYR